VSGSADSARIYLTETDAERQIIASGPAVIGPGGERRDVPELALEAALHVVEAMQAGMAVKVLPLRPELPIDEAAYAVGMAGDDLRAYAAEGAIPFRSSQYVDWVRLRDVIALDRRIRQQRRDALQALRNEDPWDEPGLDGSQS
jgi:hypothetical protein